MRVFLKVYLEVIIENIGIHLPICICEYDYQTTIIQVRFHTKVGSEYFHSKAYPALRGKRESISQ